MPVSMKIILHIAISATIIPLSQFSFMKGGGNSLNCERNTGHLTQLFHLQPSYVDLSCHFTQISGSSCEICCQKTFSHSSREDGNSAPYLSSFTRNCYVVYVDICATPPFCLLTLAKIKSDFTLSSPLHLKAAMYLLFLLLVCFLPLTSLPVPITTCVHPHVTSIFVLSTLQHSTRFPALLQAAAWFPLQWHCLHSHCLWCCMHKYEIK